MCELKDNSTSFLQRYRWFTWQSTDMYREMPHSTTELEQVTNNVNDISNENVGVFCPRNPMVPRAVFPFHIGYRAHEIDAYKTGPFAPPFPHSMAPLTHMLEAHYLLYSRPPLRSFIRSLARSLTHSGAHGIEIHVCELSASISCIYNP